MLARRKVLKSTTKSKPTKPCTVWTRKQPNLVEVAEDLLNLHRGDMLEVSVADSPSRKADPFCRLRVPRYLKFFEAVFFVTLLGLYYAVLVPIQRNGRTPKLPPPDKLAYLPQSPLGPTEYPPKSFHTIMPAEVFLYIWIAGFAYDECK